jgi:hypothetical protein
MGEVHRILWTIIKRKVHVAGFKVDREFCEKDRKLSDPCKAEKLTGHLRNFQQQNEHPVLQNVAPAFY